MRLFGNRNFLIAASCLGIGSFAFYIFVIIGPLWMQTQLGYTPTLAGQVMAVVGCLSIFFGPFFGINLDRFGVRQVATIGFTAFGFSAWMSGSITSDVSFGHLQLVRLLAGIGIAGFFVPMTAISLSQIKPQLISAATGLTNFLRNMGGSVGTAIGVTIWQNQASTYHANLVEYINPGNVGYEQAVNVLSSKGMTSLQISQYIDILVNTQAYVLSTNHLLMLSGLIMVSLIPVIWFAKPPFGGGGGGH